jgi:aminoglycoside phosphotransferase (APT) family kinase protein
MAQDWREGIDLIRLAAWMDTQQLGTGSIDAARLLTGGTQNLLLHFVRDGRSYVLRRPPVHLRPGNNETMLKEARVLAALAGTDVPHPSLIAKCQDEQVLGAAFYLMEPVDGVNITVDMPLLYSNDPASRTTLGEALIDAIVALGRIDYLAVGLGDLGKVDGFLERQVGRWHSQYLSYRTHQGWPGVGSLPAVDTVAQWLERNRPASFLPGIMHGDYQLSNVLVRTDTAAVAAIVDWELATIGDPLLDLGWLLATWPEPDGRGGVFEVTPWEGFPPAHELIARYAEQSPRNLRSIEWYTVLACFKLGILNEGTYARACSGKAAKETGERLHGISVRLLERAREMIGHGLS